MGAGRLGTAGVEGESRRRGPGQTARTGTAGRRRIVGGSGGARTARGGAPALVDDPPAHEEPGPVCVRRGPHDHPFNTPVTLRRNHAAASLPDDDVAPHRHRAVVRREQLRRALPDALDVVEDRPQVRAHRVAGARGGRRPRPPGRSRRAGRRTTRGEVSLSPSRRARSRWPLADTTVDHARSCPLSRSRPWWNASSRSKNSSRPIPGCALLGRGWPAARPRRPGRARPARRPARRARRPRGGTGRRARGPGRRARRTSPPAGTPAPGPRRRAGSGSPAPAYGSRPAPRPARSPTAPCPGAAPA